MFYSLALHGVSRIFPTKFEACKSFLVTESFIVLKIKNTWLIFIIIKNLFIIKEFKNEKIISQILEISKVHDQNGDRVSKNDKSYYICSIRLWSVFA